MQMPMVYGKHQAINNHSPIESVAPVWNWYFQINSNDSLTPDEISLDVFQIIWMISMFNPHPLVPHICFSELGQHWFR